MRDATRLGAIAESLGAEGRSRARQGQWNKNSAGQPRGDAKHAGTYDRGEGCRHSDRNRAQRLAGLRFVTLYRILALCGTTL